MLWIKCCIYYICHFFDFWFFFAFSMKTIDIDNIDMFLYGCCHFLTYKTCFVSLYIFILSFFLYYVQYYLYVSHTRNLNSGTTLICSPVYGVLKSWCKRRGFFLFCFFKIEIVFLHFHFIVIHLYACRWTFLTYALAWPTYSYFLSTGAAFNHALIFIKIRTNNKVYFTRP